MLSSAAPMTFLQLVQRYHRESGSSGTAQTTTATSVVQWQRECDNIALAYIDIQNKHEDWLWLTQDCTFDTVANQQSYSPFTTAFTTPAAPTGLTDFGSWELSTPEGESSFRLWLKSAGVFNETYLDGSLDYPSFRDYYLFGARRTTTARPISITADPQKNLLLGLTPNDVYTVTGKYHQAAQLLSLDTDVPAMPARFHMLIVWYALEHYALFESAPEVLARAQKFGARFMTQLETDQLPSIQLPGPLA